MKVEIKKRNTEQGQREPVIEATGGLAKRSLILTLFLGGCFPYLTLVIPTLSPLLVS